MRFISQSIFLILISQLRPLKNRPSFSSLVVAFTVSDQSSSMSKRSFSIDSQSSDRSGKRLRKVQSLESENMEDINLTPSVSLESQKSVERVSHVRDEVLPRDFPTLESKYFLKIISWNVNGLRALKTKNLDILERLITQHQPDIFCLQETKLQQEFISEFENLLPNYSSVWSCSTVKKGYSGTVGGTKCII